MAAVSVEVMAKCIPLIVILGGTGTGKSKLAIEIAKRLRSEIISADSMQVYKGLDILTNKVTLEERSEIPHHLIDCVSPLKNFTVVDFRNNALPIIQKLLQTGKPPVVVGGTNYYIESLIFRVLVETYKPNKNEYVNEKKTDLILDVGEKLGLRPMSRSMKKKGDELIVSEQDNTISSMIIFNELSVLINYPNKVLKSMKDIIVEENCGDKLKCIVDSIINNEPIDDVSKQIKLFKESLTDSHTENAEILIKCLTDSLIIKNNINEIAESLKKELNISSSEFNIDHFSSDKLFDNLQSCDKLKSSLPIIQCAVQKLRQFLASHVQWYINVLGKNGEIDTDMDALSSLQLYDSLKRIDPVRASALHPNDKRKITRSLEVWTLTGRRHSDILNEQRSQGSLLGGPLRFENTIIFWLTADKEVLNKRLDDRVYQMLGHGLVDELLAFHSEYHPNEGDFTRGIFQSIGFKEFRDFLMLSDEEKFGEVGKKKLNEGIETLKLVTQRYVKNQNKWIRNRFLKCPDRQVPPVYNLDTTDVEHWDDLVLEPAMDVIINTMEGKKSTKLKPLQQEKILTVDELTAMRTGEYYCDTCNRLFIGEQQWKEHISSGKHKKMLCKKRKSEDLQENIKIKSEEETEKYSKKFKFSEASTSVSVTDSDNEGPNLTNK